MTIYGSPIATKEGTAVDCVTWWLDRNHAQQHQDNHGGWGTPFIFAVFVAEDSYQLKQAIENESYFDVSNNRHLYDKLSGKE